MEAVHLGSLPGRVLHDESAVIEGRGHAHTSSDDSDDDGESAVVKKGKKEGGGGEHHHPSTRGWFKLRASVWANVAAGGGGDGDHGLIGGTNWSSGGGMGVPGAMTASVVAALPSDFPSLVATVKALTTAVGRLGAHPALLHPQSSPPSPSSSSSSSSPPRVLGSGVGCVLMFDALDEVRSPKP